MSNIKIGYKIVTVEDGRYFSMGKGFLLGQLHCMQYHTDKRAYPIRGYGPLCVFKSLKSAARSIKRLKFHHPGSLTIFRCMYRRSSREGVWIPDGDIISMDVINGRSPGTRLADWVRLIEEIDDERG